MEKLLKAYLEALGAMYMGLPQYELALVGDKSRRF